MQDLQKLKADGAVEEVHVVDWFPKHERPLTNGYRRLDAYLESTLVQLGRADICMTGIVQASLFAELAAVECFNDCRGWDKCFHQFFDCRCTQTKPFAEQQAVILQHAAIVCLDTLKITACVAG